MGRLVLVLTRMLMLTLTLTLMLTLTSGKKSRPGVSHVKTFLVDDEPQKSEPAHPAATYEVRPNQAIAVENKAMGCGSQNCCIGERFPIYEVICRPSSQVSWTTSPLLFAHRP